MKTIEFRKKKQRGSAFVGIKPESLAENLRKWNKKSTRYVLMIDDALATDLPVAQKEALLKVREGLQSVVISTQDYAA